MNVTTLADGIGFTEGPLWTSDGRLLVVALSRGAVVEIDMAGGVLSTVDAGGGPNGLAEDDNGAVWIAQNGGTVRPSRSTRPAAPGLQTLVADDVVDVTVPDSHAPNDLALGPDGRIWFTDPGRPGHPENGRLCALDRLSGTVDVVLHDTGFPNGLAFAGNDLLLAHTLSGTISRHHWDGTQLVPGGAPFVLPGGGADGLALDVEGRIYAAVPEADAVVVLAPDGTVSETIDFGEPTFPTNVCFAGPDLDKLVVTAAKGGRVLLCDRAGAARGRPVGGA